MSLNFHPTPSALRQCVTDVWLTNDWFSFLLVSESYRHVGLHFEHKLVAVDPEKGHLTFKWYVSKKICLFMINCTVIGSVISYKKLMLLLSYIWNSISNPVNLYLLYSLANNDQILEVDADHIIGSDGAYSAVRRELMKRPRYSCRVAVKCLRSINNHHEISCPC